MSQGTVKKWKEESNYGFIKTADWDVFFHKSWCVDGYEPRENDEVSFVMWKSERTGKSQAQDVKLVE